MAQWNMFCRGRAVVINIGVLQSPPPSPPLFSKEGSSPSRVFLGSHDAEWEEEEREQAHVPGLGVNFPRGIFQEGGRVGCIFRGWGNWMGEKRETWKIALWTMNPPHSVWKVGEFDLFWLLMCVSLAKTPIWAWALGSKVTVSGRQGCWDQVWFYSSGLGQTRRGGGCGAGEGHARGVGLTRPTSVGHHGGGDRHLPFSVSPAELVLFPGVSSSTDGWTASPPPPRPPGGPFTSPPAPSLHMCLSRCLNPPAPSLPPQPFPFPLHCLASFTL